MNFSTKKHTHIRVAVEEGTKKKTFKISEHPGKNRKIKCLDQRASLRKEVYKYKNEKSWKTYIVIYLKKNKQVHLNDSVNTKVNKTKTIK